MTCRADAGSVVALVGPNGAGKSTLLRAIAGDRGLALSGGSVQVDGDVAFCPDSTVGFLDLSALENLELLAVAMGLSSEDRASRIERLTRLLDMDDLIHRRLTDLSLGLRRRVDIALVACRSADVYLFDEPFNGLDASWICAFSRILQVIAMCGRTALVASHATDLLLPVADTLWEMRAGSLIRERRGTRGSLTVEASLMPEGTAPGVETMPWLAGAR
ncbi:MAG: ATP-binding cassette domain-containing protein [Spirochaetota bacterium]